MPNSLTLSIDIISSGRFSCLSATSLMIFAYSLWNTELKLAKVLFPKFSLAFIISFSKTLSLTNTSKSISSIWSMEIIFSSILFSSIV